MLDEDEGGAQAVLPGRQDIEAAGRIFDAAGDDEMMGRVREKADDDECRDGDVEGAGHDEGARLGGDRDSPAASEANGDSLRQRTRRGDERINPQRLRRGRRRTAGG